MEHILTSIIEKLEANAVALGLSMVDEEYGQVDIIDDGSRETYPVTFPAVFVDFQGVQWESLGRRMQKGTATVAVNVYVDCYDDTHAYSTTIGKASERMALVRSVTELLQGWEPDGASGQLIRTGAAASTGNHGIKLYQTTFTVPVYETFESSGEAEVRTVKVTAEIKR